MVNPEMSRDRPLILVVDDDPATRLLARATLEQKNFAMIEAENGSQGLTVFKEKKPDTVLLDVVMPDMNGFEVCAALRALPECEYTPILMITGLNDLESINQAYEQGATDFITKPINWTILGHRVRYMVRAGRTLADLMESERRLAQAQRLARLGYWQWLVQSDRLIWSGDLPHMLGFSSKEGPITWETFISGSHPDDRNLINRVLGEALALGKSFDIDYRLLPPDAPERVVNLQGQVVADNEGAVIQLMGTVQDITARKQAEKLIKKSFAQLQKTLQGTVCALSSTVEIRDPYTAGHQELVARLAGAIAREMGLPARRIKGIKVAGALHDIGKINIPVSILSKPSHLTDIELSLIKSHPQVSYEILKEIEFPWPVAQTVLQHHERMDGSGYPQSLRGEDILLEARILAVADVVEAMVHYRPYRPALSLEEALEEIRRNRGSKYDPQVADACLKVFAQGFTFW